MSKKSAISEKVTGILKKNSWQIIFNKNHYGNIENIIYFDVKKAEFLI